MLAFQEAPLFGLLYLLIHFDLNTAAAAALTTNETANATQPLQLQHQYSCDLAIFVPFSYNETHGNTFGLNGLYNFQGETDASLVNNLGFSQMAAAALAVNHFQTRNTAVINDDYFLKDEIGDKCPNLNVTIRGVYDTSIADLGLASQSLLQVDVPSNGHRFPCAIIAGVYNRENVDQDFESITTGMQRPLLMYRDYYVEPSAFAPYSSSVFPDMRMISNAIFDFMLYKERTDYFAVLFNRLGAKSSVWVSALFSVFDDVDIRLYDYEVSVRKTPPPGALNSSTNEVPESVDEGETVEATMRRLKEEGFRNIICVMERHDVEGGLIANAADKLGLNTEDFFWTIVGLDPSTFSLPVAQLSQEWLRMLVGAAIVSPMEGFVHDKNDSFLQAWKDAHNDTELINSINNLHLVEDNSTSEYYQAGPNYFQDHVPASGAGYMYDSVMATILGACETVAQLLQLEEMTGIRYDVGGDIPVEAHLSAIRQVNFTGATGTVNMDDGRGGGTVHPLVPTYGVMNLFPWLAGVDESEWMTIFNRSVGLEGVFTISDILEPNNGSKQAWVELEPFVFRSGKTMPPPLLRTIPNQNYLKPAQRITGLTIMGIIVAGCVAASTWLVVNRKTRTVLASQPQLMHCICFGCFVEASAIFFVSVDESNGWSQDGLDVACSMTLWLVALGHIITFSFLFAKLWRVNRLLQFRRTVVSIHSVAWPTGIIFISAVGLLIAMQVVAPMHWVREVTDPITGESFGTCTSDYFNQFVYPVVTLMLVPHLLTGYMAWRTMDVDEEFSESYWIFILIALQLEVILLGVPSIFLLKNVLTSGRYFGLVCLIAIFPASTIGLLVIPKVLAHRRLVKGNPSQHRGAAHGNVQVTGVNELDESARESAAPSTENQPAKI